MSENQYPLSVVVPVESYDPPRRLWHIPNTHEGYCPGCEKKVESSVLQFGGHDWHPDCFRCSLCAKPFGQEGCVKKDTDLILHQKCYKQCFCERCAICTNLIKPKKVVQAVGKNFHQKCFKCMKCGVKIESFMPLYNFPYCNHCYEELLEYFPKCLACKKAISPSQESKDFFFHGRKYFVHFPDCFKCIYCNNISGPLQPSTSRVYDNRLICKNCYDTGMKKICAYCNEPIFDQGNKIGDIQWHTNHFTCSVCNAPLKPNTAVFNAGVLKCKSCSSEDRGKCPGCGRAVVGGGKNACGALWHPECFKCRYCQTNLSNVKLFRNVGNLPCCKNCFKKLQDEGKLDHRGNLIVQTKHKHHHH